MTHVAMTEEEFIRLNYQRALAVFPKTCHTCGRRYETLRAYVLTAKPIGPAISYDVELGEWHPVDPLGTVALANCPCGSTMALTNAEEPLPVIPEMLDWLQVETETRGVSAGQLLDHVRNEVRKLALADSIDSPSP
jgi:hypothetical protein